MVRQANAIECEGLWKVFGPLPDREFEKLKHHGANKEEIQKRLGCVVAVAGASLTIAPGEIFCIMGLSGSGKSTLLRMINGLVTPSAGTVRVAGEMLSGLRPGALRELRARKIGMVFQNFALLPHRSVLENAAFGLELRGVPRGERLEKARETLKTVQLEAWAGARISELSGGMQQRVGLARALAGDPDILLMDEPFGALDPIIRRQLQEQFKSLCNRMNKTAVFITHDLDEAMRIGSRIAIMRDGRILQVGEPHEIILAPADEHVAIFVRDVSSREMLKVRHVMSAMREGEADAFENQPGVLAESPVSEAALIAARTSGDLPVRGLDGALLGVMRVPDILTALAGRGRDG